MGKIKRQRKKLHPPAVRTEELATGHHHADSMDTGSLQPAVLFATKGLFNDSHDEPYTLRGNFGQHDDDEDRMTFVSKKSIKSGKQMTKVEKRKVRHDRWLEKIDTIKTAQRREKDAKRRAGAPVVGDLHPLQDALPELSEILRIGPDYTQQRVQSKDNQPQKKPRATLKVKDKQKLMMEETARFQEVLKHSAFKANPFATINEHLRNKLKQEQEADET
ncbi:ribosome biogenesis protein SLX9 homolog isoform X1 [Diadema setosum]|uniref:ribosome biogenesis protein SLX9 homolog isoform X1 n=1 Tax=Diadema setosum TaxID=31175 RepID=UPI003B3BC2EE